MSKVDMTRVVLHDEVLCEGCRRQVPVEEAHVSTADLGTHTVSTYLCGACEYQRRMAPKPVSEGTRRKV